MILGKKDKLEMERLREAEAALTQRVADLEEANRVLTEAIGRHRTELTEAEKKIGEAEAREGRLLLDLERERALTEELRGQLAEAIDVEKEAEAINARLDRIAKERADYEAKIANLRQTIDELRSNTPGTSRLALPVDFTDLEDEVAPDTPAPAKTRPYGEPFRPALPPSESDRAWLSDLPPF